MKAASRQGNMTVEKLNGDMNRRPSYPGELRAKHANMSTKIWVKVAMAIAYFLCVSVAAFILVIYYVFFWTPGKADNITATPNQNPNQNVCLAKPWWLLQHARTHALNKWLHTPDTRLRRRRMDGWEMTAHRQTWLHPEFGMLTEDLREDRGGQVLPGCISVPHAGCRWRGGGGGDFSFQLHPNTQSWGGLWFFVFHFTELVCPMRESLRNTHLASFRAASLWFVAVCL